MRRLCPRPSMRRTQHFEAGFGHQSCPCPSQRRSCPTPSAAQLAAVEDLGTVGLDDNCELYPHDRRQLSQVVPQRSVLDRRAQHAAIPWGEVRGLSRSALRKLKNCSNVVGVLLSRNVSIAPATVREWWHNLPPPGLVAVRRAARNP